MEEVGTTSSKVNDFGNRACLLPSPRCGSRLGLIPRGASLRAAVLFYVCAKASNVKSTAVIAIPLSIKRSKSLSSGKDPPPA
jgi:hypothetical protein